MTSLLRHRYRFLLGTVLACALGPFWLAPSNAIEIEFRLACELESTCNSGDFFSEYPEALDALQFAARAYAPFADALTGATLSSATFTHPLTGQHNFAVSGLSVPADTLLVYVAGRDLAVGRVGEASVGESSLPWNRGQGNVSGPAADDFAPWGGSIAFDTLDDSGNPRPWHFDISTRPPPGKLDFLSVALHELGHVFGFGTADSFANLVTDHLFTGPQASALYGGSVPTFEEVGHPTQHWDDNLTSPPAVKEPRVALSRLLYLGRRTLITPLDYAAYADIGWQVPDRLLDLHGNFNADARVDGGDFLEWQRSLSGVGQASQGDPVSEHPIASYELWLWSQNFGATKALAAASGTSVPEPTGTILLASGLLCGYGRRFRAGNR